MEADGLFWMLHSTCRQDHQHVGIINSSSLWYFRQSAPFRHSQAAEDSCALVQILESWGGSWQWVFRHCHRHFRAHKLFLPCKRFGPVSEGCFDLRAAFAVFYHHLHNSFLISLYFLKITATSQWKMHFKTWALVNIYSNHIQNRGKCPTGTLAGLIKGSFISQFKHGLFNYSRPNYIRKNKSGGWSLWSTGKSSRKGNR